MRKKNEQMEEEEELQAYATRKENARQTVTAFLAAARQRLGRDVSQLIARLV